MKNEIRELVDNPLILSDANVWTPPIHHEFSYSDGAGPEACIESIVADAIDLSSDSVELERSTFDWATEYHLSRTRAQLLRAFEFAGSSRVLEVGCGCGAITRLLGERFSQVVAIEGSPVRARIARSRTRDLQNVSIINSPFQEIKFNSTFDLVFCIGVFEYSQMFVDAPDPYDEILRTFSEYLSAGGALVLAIENQFGLKYFSGSKEDHTGIAYDGIEGYPRFTNKARTFGYEELRDRLGKHFPHMQFYFPYPDYKVPECVLSEDFLRIPYVAELIGSYRARDYPGGPSQTFDERLVLMELMRNRQLHFFGNSFLVVASKSEIRPDVFPYLGVHYSSARNPEYQTVTHFIERDNNTIVATKCPLVARNHVPGDKLQLHSTESTWTGKLSIQSEIHSLVKSRQIPLEEVFAPAVIWVEYLRENANIVAGQSMLSGAFIDCIWKNCYTIAGQVEFIDREWEWPTTVSLEVLAVRAIYRFIIDIEGMTDLRPELRLSSRRKLIRTIGHQIGLDLNSSHIEAFVRLETSFLSTVYGQPEFKLRLRLWIALSSRYLSIMHSTVLEAVKKVRRKLRYRYRLAKARSTKH